VQEATGAAAVSAAAAAGTASTACQVLLRGLLHTSHLEQLSLLCHVSSEWSSLQLFERLLPVMACVWYGIAGGDW
jgi:hypothetical protein